MFAMYVEKREDYHKTHLALVIEKVTRKEMQLSSKAASGILLQDSLQQATQLFRCKMKTRYTSVGMGVT